MIKTWLPYAITAAVSTTLAHLMDWPTKSHVKQITAANQRLSRQAAELETLLTTQQRMLDEHQRRLAIFSALSSDFACSFCIDHQQEWVAEWLSERFIHTFQHTIEDINRIGGLCPLLHPDDVMPFRQFANELLYNKQAVIEVRLQNPGIHWLRVVAYPQWSENEQRVVGAIGLLQDITVQRTYQQQLQSLEYSDPLTGLANRTMLRHMYSNDNVEHGKQRVAMLAMDIERLKTINSSLGYLVGDNLLVQFAQRLRSALREEDVAFRLSSDEFGVVLHNVNEYHALRIAQRLSDRLSSAYVVGSHVIHLQLKVGVACGETTDLANELLLQQALKAFQQAHLALERVSVYRAASQNPQLDWFEIEAELRHALIVNTFEVHYQPICALHTDRIVRYEALVRWNHCLHGMISPAIFLPIAEENGLMRDIDRLVLAKVCRDIAQYPHLREAETVAINLSTASLDDPHLVDDFQRCFQQTGVAPTSIMVEITENATIRDINLAKQALHALKQLGVKIAIDDFGSGFTSLSYLKLLPVDVIKIDRSFIDGIGNSPQDESIVSSLLTLGRGLNITLIAEGVERPEQLAWLSQVGFDEVQGFLLGRPTPLVRMA